MTDADDRAALAGRLRAVHEANEQRSQELEAANIEARISRQNWQERAEAAEARLRAVEAHQEGLKTVCYEVEEFCGWWHLNREGNVNRTYDYLDKLTKRLRVLVEAALLPAAGVVPSPQLVEKKDDTDEDDHARVDRA